MTHLISLTTIGDCCVDIYPDTKKVFLGGTAFNVAYHAKKAGANASIISLVGSDTYGDLFLSTAKKEGISTKFLQQVSGETSRVNIPLDPQGRPQFEEWKLGVLRKLTLTKAHQTFLSSQHVARAILLKGLEHSFNQFREMVLPNTFKIADMAGGSLYSFSTEEIESYTSGLDMIVRSTGFANKKELSVLELLAKKYNILVLASLGKEGSIVFTPEKEYFHAAPYVSVTDTTGAGDAYIAYFIIHYIQTKNIPEAMDLATKAAVNVVQQFGSNIA